MTASTENKTAGRLYMPARFWDAVCVHLALNFGRVPGSPLILGIDGPPGVGKTFQLDHALRALDVQTVLISGGQLEDASAGLPAKLIRKSYLQVSDIVRDGEPAALVFNDLDTGLGEWEGNTGTVNHQTVLGELMHLVDSPESVAGHSTERCPVFATGNDFTKIYTPLRRAGRMEVLTWEPDAAERLEIIRRIFYDRSESTVEGLAAEFSEQPIAFFSHLRATANRDSILAVIGGEERSWMKRLVTGGLLPAQSPIGDLRLLEVAHDLVRAGTVMNHL